MKKYQVLNIRIPSGETIAYRECGQGPTVVLLHGNMSSSVHWQTTMEALESRYHVIAPDLRGFGDSSYFAPFDSLRELAADIMAFLEILGEFKFSLVGWSTGGGVAMEVAADWPERVIRLVLLDSVPLTGYPMFRKDGKGQPILTDFLSAKEDIAADPVQVIPALNAMANQDRAVMRAIWDAAIYNLRQPTAEEYEANLTATLKERCLVDTDHALAHFNISHRHNGVEAGNGRMDLIQCPIHILQGQLDMVVPEAWTQQMLKDFGGKAQYVSFMKAGHSVITDDPPLFFNTLKGILG